MLVSIAFEARNSQASSFQALKLFLKKAIHVMRFETFIKSCSNGPPPWFTKKVVKSCMKHLIIDQPNIDGVRGVMNGQLQCLPWILGDPARRCKVIRGAERDDGDLHAF